ncbi:MAG: 3'-5' exonuclease [Flavobacteriales bacterium]|nr:3'-5' exonuclease [Flavobacteriales bacterium]
MYLFLDTETTGLPLDWKAPVGQLENWPRIVEIGWILTDKDGQEIESETIILKPDGFKIPADASAIHGITNEIANEKGQDRVEVLKKFSDLLSKATVLVAHNIDFDKKVVHAEFMRYNIKSSIHKIDKLCTKELTTDYCKLPGRYGYKWPTLEELYEKVFSTSLTASHSALGDVKACKDCFFELVNRGVIKLFGSKVLVDTVIDTDDEDLIQIDDIEDEITYNGDFQYFTRVRHLGLKEHKFLKAYDEWVLEEKIERQVERFNAKWEKVKGKLQSDYYKQSNILEAEEKTKEAEEQIKQLETLLEQTINVNDAVNWEELKNHRPFKEVSPENYLQTRLDKITKPIKAGHITVPKEPLQTDSEFQPQFNFLEKYLFKSWQQKKIDKSIQDFKNSHSNWLAEKARIEKQNKDNIEKYEQDTISYNKEIERTKEQNRDEVIEWEKRKEQYYKDQSDFNNKIDLMKEEYLQKKPHSIIENCDLVLNNSTYPDYFPKTYELDYNPDKEHLVIDFCLPQIESLPRTKSVKYVKTEDNFKETSISNTALNQLYSSVVFQVAIRTVHEIFEADVVNAISTVCFNGYVDNDKIEYIISYQSDKETFNKLNLKGLDCKETIKNYKGKFTAKLTEIEPLMKIEHKTKQTQ